MLSQRVIPALLLRDGGLYKGVQFKSHRYVGDPLVALKIFNEKEVDEICVLDITATAKGAGPDFELIEDLASQCFMPLAYGGGVYSVEQMSKLYYLGVEKVVLGSSVHDAPDLVDNAAKRFGSQSVVAVLEVGKSVFGSKTVFTRSGRKNTKRKVLDVARELEQRGAGELLVNCVYKDGTMSGYDLDLLRTIVDEINVPVIALGGAGDVTHFVDAIEVAGVSAVAAGSMFVFQGPHRAVLINMPDLNQDFDFDKKT